MINPTIDNLTRARALIYKMNDENRVNLILDLLVLIAVSYNIPLNKICVIFGDLQKVDDGLNHIRIAATIEHITDAVKLVESNV